MFDMTSTPEYGNNQEAIIAPERKVNKLEIAEEGFVWFIWFNQITRQTR